MLNDTLGYSVIVTVVSNAGNLALCAIGEKYKKLGGLRYYKNTKMYNVGVCHILVYAAEIWGFKEYSKINNVQYNSKNIPKLTPSNTIKRIFQNYHHPIQFKEYSKINTVQ